jgi:hypothetical protein
MIVGITLTRESQSIGENPLLDPIWTELGLNPDIHGHEPATNSLIHSTAPTEMWNGEPHTTTP